MGYCRDVIGYCRDVMGYCRDVMGAIKKSREKNQNRGAILNFFEFVRTRAPYAQQRPGAQVQNNVHLFLCFLRRLRTLFWSWALGRGMPPWALIVNGVMLRRGSTLILYRLAGMQGLEA